ncbi:MAG: hypothetical protein IKL77_01445, partial [Clostridia bacterium]|nr:hypothetical protein [Clostridia bacterium]
PDATTARGWARDAITSKNACGQALLARICIFAKLLFKRTAFETTFLNLITMYLGDPDGIALCASLRMTTFLNLLTTYHFKFTHTLRVKRAN